MAAQQSWYGLQAKTIEEIHAEAHAELGMMPATVIPALESLAALPRQTAAEVELFPSFKGGKLAMWIRTYNVVFWLSSSASTN